MTSVTVRHLAVASLAVVAAGCAQSPPTPEPSASPAVTSAPPASGPRLYVSDETGGRIIVVDLASGQIAANIAVGKRPRGLRLSRDGSQLFVALSGSPIGGPNVDESKLPPADRSADGIGVIDIAKGQLIRKLKAGPDPESFDLSPDGATLYASNEDAAEMSIVDVQSGEVRLRVKVGEEPEGVTVRPDGREVYVTCEGSNQVVAIDTATGKVVAHISVGARPRAVVFTSDGRTGFVTNENDGSISVVDTASHRTTATIKLPQTEAMPTVPRPMGAAIASDGPNIFFSLGRARAIAVVDASTRKPVRAIENVGDRPWGIAISSDGRTLYTANGPSGDISFVDVATGAITRRTATGGSPWGAVLGK